MSAVDRENLHQHGQETASLPSTITTSIFGGKLSLMWPLMKHKLLIHVIWLKILFCFFVWVEALCPSQQFFSHVRT